MTEYWFLIGYLQLLVPGAELWQPSTEVGDWSVLEVVGDLAHTSVGHTLLGTPDTELSSGATSEICTVTSAVEWWVTMLSSKHDHWLKQRITVMLIIITIKILPCSSSWSWHTGALPPSQYHSEIHLSRWQCRSLLCRADCARRCWKIFEITMTRNYFTVVTYNRQLFGLGMWGSARNFLSIMVQVSATTFILRVSMNFASSPQIQAMRTVSETLQNEYILRYQRSSIGIEFSSTLFQRVMISVMSGLRKGSSYARNILLTTPNTNLLALSCFCFGRGGSKILGFFCRSPRGIVHMTWSA